ncbi:MAG TPA: hypothetical protein VFR02_06650 [bacterium]|nr:hypothetical protein [bacterium]
MRSRLRRPALPTPSGQAAVEYLLLLGLVFTVFLGASSLFSKQVQNYLDLLFGTLCPPF